MLFDFSFPEYLKADFIICDHLSVLSICTDFSSINGIVDNYPTDSNYKL